MSEPKLNIFHLIECRNKSRAYFCCINQKVVEFFDWLMYNMTGVI